MRFTKKIAAALMALTLILAVGTTCMAGTWGTYFGADEGWYEGASGKLTQDQPNAFTASLAAIGWGGVWGCQVHKPVKIAKGSTNIVSFTVSSSKVNKYIYVKISKGEALATSFWVYLPKGQSVKVSKKFVAANDATDIYFGIGGDFGDRSDVTTDEDATVRYKVFNENFKGKGTFETLLKEDADNDPTAVTEIKVSNLVLTGKPAKAKIKSAKAQKGRKVKVTWKKVTGANGYQVQVGSKKKTTTKTSLTIKASGKKGKKVSCKVRAYAGNKALYGAWSSAKKVKLK